MTALAFFAGLLLGAMLGVGGSLLLLASALRPARSASGWGWW